MSAIAAPVMRDAAKGSDEKATKLTISDALLTAANISESLIHNAHSVDTKALIVTESAEFHDDVLVEGSITVQGSVIGSGPYVDSSDERLKRDIRPLDRALDKVMMLQAVGIF